jgi:hypothetical protein
MLSVVKCKQKKTELWYLKDAAVMYFVARERSSGMRSNRQRVQSSCRPSETRADKDCMKLSVWSVPFFCWDCAHSNSLVQLDCEKEK